MRNVRNERYACAGSQNSFLPLGKGKKYQMYSVSFRRTVHLAFVKWAVTWQDQQSDYTPNEHSDQPRHPPSLKSLHCSHDETLGHCYPMSAQWRPDQTGRMFRLIWIFALCRVSVLILSCCGLNMFYWAMTFSLFICVCYVQSFI